MSGDKEQQERDWVLKQFKTVCVCVCVCVRERERERERELHYLNDIKSDTSEHQGACHVVSSSAYDMHQGACPCASMMM